MASRRTNLALLWTILLALVSGVGAFLVGTSAATWVVVTHGVLALAVMVLTPWKSVIAARGLARPRPGRAVSIALSVMIVLVIISGMALVTGELEEFGPLTTMQVHVGASVAAVSLTLLHTLERPVSPRRADLDRRNVLRAGGLLAAAGVTWLVVEATLDLTGARGSRRRFTGSHEIVDPARVPATQWLNDGVQHLDGRNHVVTVAGVAVGVEELYAPGDVMLATLDCTGGWFTTQEWMGTRLDRLIGGDGRTIVVRSVTGYWRRFPMEHAAHLLLATHMAGSPLPDGNGGPARLVAPGRRGYWWVKWVDTIEIDDDPPWWQPPLPTA